jgi:hypothetical protein
MVRSVALLVILVASLGCDAFVRARIQVVSSEGGIPDALLRLQRASDHDLARFTDAEGCAYFSGVVGPARSVHITVTKPGFATQGLDLPIAREECLVVRLAREGSGRGSVESLQSDACPCDSKAGYSPTMAARFKVIGTDDKPIELVGVRRSDRPRNPWLQVTDAAGCLGIKWIVPADKRDIPLVLEKAGFQPVEVTVPTMEDRCYKVSLSPATGRSSAELVKGNENCECEMFSGQTTWPER